MPTKKNRVAKLAEATEIVDLRSINKTNEAIGLRVREGRLSLLTRKLLNVMIYHAQQQREPGANAPIKNATSHQYFWIPVSELARDAAYDSKDMNTLREQLRELQRVKFFKETDRQLTDEILVSSLTFVNPQGFRNKHSGQVWLGFAFPPEVQQHVMSPTTYTKFRIIYQAKLRSGQALSLYEVCRRYATSPSHVTYIDTYEHWHAVLTGNPPSDAAELTPYKYFKRDVLKPCIQEINQLTDITVELIEHKEGRRVARLQFHVELSQQSQLSLECDEPLIDTALSQQIEALGYTTVQAVEMISTYGPSKVRAALTLIEARRNSKNLTPLESVHAYFTWALKNEHGTENITDLQPRERPAAPKAQAKTADAGAPTQAQAELVARALRAMEHYEGLPEADAAALFAEFQQLHAGSVVKHRKLSSKMTRSVFSQWYATRLWGELPQSDPAQAAWDIEEANE